MTKRITIDAPDSVTILAARHLDETEGPVQIGDVVTASTRGAINRVLNYIAKAHSAPADQPPAICELPHETIEEEEECDAERARGSAVLRQAAADFDARAEYILYAVEERAAFVAKACRAEAATWREAAGRLRFLAAEPNTCGPPPDSCDPGGEPCARHEREESHADGEHELCGDECAEKDRSPEDIVRRHVMTLHLIGEQLAGVESWMWNHLADVRGVTTTAPLKQTLTRAIFALKDPMPPGSGHWQAGFDDGLDAAIDAVARVFDTAPGKEGT